MIEGAVSDTEELSWGLKVTKDRFGISPDPEGFEGLQMALTSRDGAQIDVETAELGRCNAHARKDQHVGAIQLRNDGERRHANDQHELVDHGASVAYGQRCLPSSFIEERVSQV